MPPNPANGGEKKKRKKINGTTNAFRQETNAIERRRESDGFRRVWYENVINTTSAVGPFRSEETR